MPSPARDFGARDANLIGAVTLMYASLTVVGVLISDPLLVVVDPRIRLTGSARRGGEGA